MLDEEELSLVHVMADLETISAKSNGGLAQIGAARYRPLRDLNYEFYPASLDTFKVTIDIESSVQMGLDMSASTMKWWMRQSDAAREEVFPETGTVHIAKALQMFTEWLGPDKEQRIWGHGASFDPVLLQNAYEACQIKPPFKFRNFRDTRTVFAQVGEKDLWGDYEDLGEIRVPKEVVGDLTRHRKMSDFGPKHSALGDAERQAVVVQRAYDKLRGTRIGTVV